MTAADPAAAAAAEGVLGGAQPQFAPCGDGGDRAGSEQQQQCVSKRPGRLQTRPTFDLEDNLDEPKGGEAVPGGGQRVANDTLASGGSAAARRRRVLLQAGGHTLASILGADSLWAQGFRGQGVRMGVFDTGIRGDHPDVKNIV
jgi:membrane-bound transcription factor site-1 protease